ncbi:MAG TPA: glycosyltransferase [Cytophagaceae bacterium]|nr:glycosyltransferase [Cytophagaceae bacterium]
MVLFFNLKEDKPASSFNASPPFVSILIAARNEEENILDCLRAIDGLSWPSDKMEVLIGDDQSTDKTAVLVETFIRHKYNFRLIHIEKNLGEAKGKANVLANLAQEAKGEFFFITDADIQVPSNWIQSLLANKQEKTGIVSGVTQMHVASVFEYCQAVDWIYGFGMIKTASDYNIPVSAVGNNMMIAASTYRSTGGYENIPFSVTEDHALFIETLKKGWTYKNLMSCDSLAITKPIPTLSKLLQQRKRWMRGAVKVPFVLLFFLLLQSLYFPIVLVMLIKFPLAAIGIWLAKILLQQFFIVHAFKKLRIPYQLLKGAILYELYSNLISSLMLVNYVIPTKVKWKGRIYV